MMELREGIDSSLLPEEGKKLINLYKFLLKKCGTVEKEKSLWTLMQSVGENIKQFTIDFRERYNIS